MRVKHHFWMCRRGVAFSVWTAQWLSCKTKYIRSKCASKRVPGGNRQDHGVQGWLCTWWLRVRSAVSTACSVTASLHAAHRCRSANWIKSLLSGCRGSTSPHLCPLGWHFLLEHLLDINFLFYLFILALLWPVTGCIPNPSLPLSPNWHGERESRCFFCLSALNNTAQLGWLGLDNLITALHISIDYHPKRAHLKKNIKPSDWFCPSWPLSGVLLRE